MDRADRVRKKAEELVSDGKKPSAARLSRELGIHDSDVHRLLNFLEQEGEIETYTRELFGRKHRMVGVRR
ncbi:MAG: helix-turn-helix domain-containing protein [Candidatus Nanohaloarchaea archaeon]